MASDLVWKKEPGRVFGAGLKEYNEKIIIAVQALGTFVAQKMQDAARRGAKWEDRTGHARSGLFGQVDRQSEFVIDIYLSHTVDYGVYLEISNGGKYAIIMVTLNNHIPELERALRALLKD